MRNTRGTWVPVCRDRKVPTPQKSCLEVPPLLLGSRSEAAHSRSREAEPEKVYSSSLGSGWALDTLRASLSISGDQLGCEPGERLCRGLRGLNEGIILLFIFIFFYRFEFWLCHLVAM